MKQCPYCLSRIQDEAQKCRHCGEWVPTSSSSIASNRAGLPFTRVVKGKQLYITDDVITFGSVTWPWNTIDGVRMGKIAQSINGIPSQDDYLVSFRSTTESPDEMMIHWRRARWLYGIVFSHEKEKLFADLTRIVEITILPRLTKSMMTEWSVGKGIQIGSFLIDKHGLFEMKKKKRTEWSHCRSYYFTDGTLVISDDTSRPHLWSGVATSFSLRNEWNAVLLPTLLDHVGIPFSGSL